MYIYKITNKSNDKVYIGQTTQKDPQQRWREHCRSSGTVSILNKAIVKYGRDNFTFEIILCSLDILELNKQEIRLIKEYNSLTPNGYNILEGGNNMVHSEYMIECIRKANSKPILRICPESQEKIEYVSIVAAARNGFTENSIRRCLRGTLKHHKGFVWKYKRQVRKKA